MAKSSGGSVRGRTAPPRPASVPRGGGISSGIFLRRIRNVGPGPKIALTPASKELRVLFADNAPQITREYPRPLLFQRVDQLRCQSFMAPPPVTKMPMTCTSCPRRSCAASRKGSGTAGLTSTSKADIGKGRRDDLGPAIVPVLTHFYHQPLRGAAAFGLRRISTDFWIFRKAAAPFIGRRHTPPASVLTSARCVRIFLSIAMLISSLRWRGHGQLRPPLQQDFRPREARRVQFGQARPYMPLHPETHEWLPKNA